jgi:peptidoglycan hydrolase-like protein with peptidoglycan-binding domain
LADGRTLQYKPSGGSPSGAESQGISRPSVADLQIDLAVSVFDRPGLYLRNPRGGVEDVATMKAGGFSWIAINVGDHAADEWSLVEQRAEASGVTVLPWRRCTNDAHVNELCDLAQREYSGSVIVNAEKELDTGEVSAEAILTATEDMDAALSTEPFVFGNLAGSRLLARLIVQLQLFPQENDPSTRPRDCRARAFELGAKKVHFMLGMHDLAPDAFPERQAPYSVFTADDCGNVFGPWSPQDPVPLEIPFTGPLFGPSHVRGPSPECGTTQALKIAMHRAGFANFANPDGIYDEALERALASFQRHVGIRATGQYGRRSHEAVRSLLAVEPGGGHALTPAAEALIESDAT